MRNLDRRHPNAALALADGTVFLGFGAGCPGIHVGELVFNTAISGYQEILTDPSYAGQIVTFTFPHIGNVGTNDEDVEALTPYARGMVARAPITDPANWRSGGHLATWLESRGIAAIAGVDTRRITRMLREGGAQNAALAYLPDSRARPRRPEGAGSACPSLEGMDLAAEVSARQRYGWDESRWQWGEGYGRSDGKGPHVVAIDYGIKRNILRSLASLGCRVTVVPADDDRRGGAGAGTGRRGPRQRPGRSGGHRQLRRAGDRASWSPAASRCSAFASATRCWGWRWVGGPRRCPSVITAPTTRSRT